MKLGVGFSVFNGAEFLKPSILNIRPFASYIVAVYSKYSNDGFPAPTYLLPLLEQLKEEKLLDEIIWHPISKEIQPLKLQVMQRKKRELGRMACLRQGCTHYITKDCDEFYIPNQFENAMKEAKEYQLIISSLYDYVGSPLLRATTVSPLYVPVIQEISCQFIPKDFGVLLDHERTCDAVTFKILKKDELIMHHFTAARYNKEELCRKFQGHSHFMRLGERAINEYMVMIDNAKVGEKYELVEDIFGIVNYWQGEFKELYERYSK